MTTLLWLPDATRDEHHTRANEWTTTKRPKGCLHTTETSGWPDYRGWKVPPHATIMPIKRQGIRVRQHIPFSSGSFALVNLDGGVQTNRAFVFQFELIGTCAASGPGYFWPGADDPVLLDLWRKVIKPTSEAFDIPLRSPAFLPYYSTGGGSYGRNNGVRLNGRQWMAYSGWVGHQHAPENVHGDPGAFPIARLFALGQADPGSTQPTQPHVPDDHQTQQPPTFPLPAGWYFGPQSGPRESVSGYHGHRDDLKRWQTRMRQRGWKITTDGYYGEQTRSIATSFQKEKGLGADGLIGVQTWNAAWSARVTR